ncbi:MAG TPA: dihydrodipicolinate synthase family protein [Burkholderiaceae bacterium]|nr:dihydrodipicolinate synthase family protein [Burkholderiaceae bacterium]HNB43773.1 dihydrodipicolinate synthase family protein [Burkholderiaceae bacterium]
MSAPAAPSPLAPAAAGAFKGIWPAMMTPLQADGRIDGGRFVAHGQRLLASGCGGLTPFGTTGEFASFSVEERIEGVEALVAGGIPAERLIVSTCAAALADVETLTRHARDLGAHGCLMLPPFYFKGIGDAGVLASFRQVIERVWGGNALVGAGGLRLYPYNIPQLSGAQLSHAVIRTLLQDYPQVIAGIKDSQCDRAYSLSLAEAFMPPLPIYVGNELDLRVLGRRGSQGAISGLANFMPRVVRQLVLDPDGAGTDAAEARVTTLLQRVGGYALLPALKGLMAAASGDAAWLRVRAPLIPLDADQAQAMAQLARELNLNLAAD